MHNLDEKYLMSGTDFSSSFALDQLTSPWLALQVASGIYSQTTAPHHDTFCTQTHHSRSQLSDGCDDTMPDAALCAHLETARVMCCKNVAATSLVSSKVALNDRAGSRELGDQQRGKTVTDLGVHMEI